jgi:GH24 family phage-related lysozyme (muramidase)
VALLPRQRDALISFCFNVEVGALEASTLRKRLLAAESTALVIKEELPRWCKGPKGELEGLKHRRAAEVAHATAFATGKPTPAHEQALIQLAVPDLRQNDSATD